MTPSDQDGVLAVTELTKIYSGRTETTAVDHITFQLGHGEILGLLGPNGAGKTTTIQMLLSTLRPTSGRIEYFGLNLDSAREAILARIGFASAYSKLPIHLTIAENLDVFGRLYGLSARERRERSQKLLERFGVWELRTRVMSGLSAGQTTRVMLAKAFLARPQVVLLDEPTASLDPDIALEVREFVREQRDAGNVSILYTSHNMDEVAQICDRVLFLDRGRIASIGRPDELAASAAETRVHLRVDTGLDDLLRIVAARGLSAQTEDGLTEIEIDERQVARFLAELAAANVQYSHITLDKPTLEDYFLMLARRATAASREGRDSRAPALETLGANRQSGESL